MSMIKYRTVRYYCTVVQYLLSIKHSNLSTVGLNCCTSLSDQKYLQGDPNMPSAISHCTNGLWEGGDKTVADTVD